MISQIQNHYQIKSRKIKLILFSITHTPLKTSKGSSHWFIVKNLIMITLLIWMYFFVFILGIDRKEEHLESKIPILSSSISFPKKNKMPKSMDEEQNIKRNY